MIYYQPDPSVTPESLRRMLDEQPGPLQPLPAASISRPSLWDWIVRACFVIDTVLKFAVIACAIWMLLEIGSAFLPCGAVHRVLGGGQ